MKRSEMKRDMLVRFRDDMDNDSFWSKLMVSRYLRVNTVDPQPDDSTWWGMSTGVVVLYKMNYVKQFSNEDVNKVSDEECRRYEEVVSDKNKYADLHKLSREINRNMSNLDNMLSDLDDYFDVSSVSIWECSDKDHLKDLIMEEASYGGLSDLCTDDREEAIRDIMDIVELFGKLCYNLDELTALENKYIRLGGNS